MAKDEHTITGRDYLTGKPVKVTMQEGIIIETEEIPPGSDAGYIIAPGLTDLQINGYAGIDLNSNNLLPEAVRDISVRLWSEGVTTFFPTIITNSPGNITSSVSAVAQACRLYPEAAGAVGGIHLEGPFISPEEGARGAHPAEHVRPPDWQLFSEWQEACGGIIRIVTLSPEWPGTTDFIRRACASGVIVAIGHTAATPEMIREAVSAGATLSTHLGNGSHQMLPRHRNYIWEQLAADELYASFIADGFHLPDAVMKVFLRTKPGKTILVSDSTNFTGMPPGNYSTHIGGEVTLTEAGKLHMRGTPDVLAGSGLSLLHCVNTLAVKGLVSQAEALDMAGKYPYFFAGLPGDMFPASGAVADLIMLEETTGRLRVVKTVKFGKTVFEIK
jgi:N-acetylglucosamine-6-phosphate deacetylase